MSLLMDLLKKVGEKERASQVPPGLKPPLRKADSKQGLKLFLLVLFMGFFSVVAYMATIYIVGGRIDSWRLEEEILAIKKSIDESNSSVNGEVVVDFPEEDTVEEVEEEEEPSVMEQVAEGSASPTVSKEIKTPERSEDAGKPKEEVKKEEIEPKEKLQAKMSNVNPNLEMEKVIEDVVDSTKAPLKGGTSGITTNILPEFANSVYYGDFYFKKGDLKRSMEFYEKAYSIRQDPKIANNLVIIYLRLGLRSKAHELLKKHGEEKLYYTYIMELARNYGYEEALGEISALMGFDRRGYLYFARGYLREGSGDVMGAYKDYSQAYRKDPSNPYFAFNYARSLEQKGELREAYRIYKSLNLQTIEPKLKDIVRSRLKELRDLGLGK